MSEQRDADGRPFRWVYIDGVPCMIPIDSSELLVEAEARVAELQDAIRSLLAHYLLRDDGALCVTLWAYADDFGGERRRISREHAEALRLLTAALRNSLPPGKTHVPKEEPAT